MKDQWIEWLGARQRHFFYGILFIVITLFAFFQIIERREAKFIGRKKEAAVLFEQWMSQAEPFEKLAALMRKHPELEASFGTKIVDKLLLENQAERAEELATGVFKRMERYIPEHVRYAQASILIEKGKREEALQMALLLKERLESNSVLYGFNLIRIASLYRSLKMTEAELISLEELDLYLKEGGQAQQVVCECFKEEERTLSSYIAERKLQNIQSTPIPN